MQNNQKNKPKINANTNVNILKLIAKKINGKYDCGKLTTEQMIKMVDPNAIYTIEIYLESSLENPVCKIQKEQPIQYFGERLPISHIMGNHILTLTQHPNKKQPSYNIKERNVTKKEADVSMKEGLGEGAIQGIIDRHIESMVEKGSTVRTDGWNGYQGLLPHDYKHLIEKNQELSNEVDWKKVKKIGLLCIDEISIKKGYKDYVTIISGWNKGEKQILGVIKGKEKAAVKRFLEGIPKNKRKTITAVCTDLCDNYINIEKIIKEKELILDESWCNNKCHQYEEIRLKSEIFGINTTKNIKGKLTGNILRNNLKTIQTEIDTIKNKMLYGTLFNQHIRYNNSDGINHTVNINDVADYASQFISP